MTSTAEPVLSRIKNRFVRPHEPKAAEIAPRNATVQKLGELSSERDRVLELAEAEEERQEELNAAAEKKDLERVNALTEARLNGRETEAQLADGLVAEAAALRRQAKESGAVAERLRERVQQLNAEIPALRQTYEAEITAFLNDYYETLMGQYTERALQLAGHILLIAATRRVMMDRRVGNSNGWDGVVLLPGMEAKRGTQIPPILDGGSQEFDAGANRRMADIWDALKAAGFTL